MLHMKSGARRRYNVISFAVTHCELPRTIEVAAFSPGAEGISIHARPALGARLLKVPDRGAAVLGDA